MEHIRQKNSSETYTYTVVITNNWSGLLTQHPSIVQHPELFEISNDSIPEDAQYLNYV